jgi:hypothetical protein
MIKNTSTVAVQSSKVETTLQENSRKLRSSSQPIHIFPFVSRFTNRDAYFYVSVVFRLCRQRRKIDYV